MRTSKLGLIAKKASIDKKLKFSALVHHINVELLVECYKELRKDAACGVDGVTVEAYGNNLMVNLVNLVGRLKSKEYKSKPVRRTYIPKPGKKELRPLGILTVEDKLVQLAVKKIIEPVFESLFLESSHGFRPRLGCHTAIKRLNQAVMYGPVNYIVEVDIEKFFDTVSHYWLLRCLEERISDPNLLWLIRRFLKAGVIENGRWQASGMGVPQGGVISPLLANIYLHYVLDLWFELKIKPKGKGYMELIRYCDDFVVVCENEQDAQEFLKDLEERFAEHNLKISQEKTKIVEFGKRAWNKARRTGGKVETFTFLGFAHYCKANRNGWFAMGHKTAKDRLKGKLVSVNEGLKHSRHTRTLKEWWEWLSKVLNGHYGYFGINGNYRCLVQFYSKVLRLIYKWMNRRSQKKSMSWTKFLEYLGWHPLPKPRIRHQIW